MTEEAERIVRDAITSADPCCKKCLRGECEYNVYGMCLNRGTCNKFAQPRKEAEDGE